MTNSQISLDDLRNEYHQQEKDKDDKQYVTLARIKYQEAENSFGQMQYHASTAQMQEAIKLSIRNLEILLSFKDESLSKKGFVLRAKGYTITYISKYIRSYIFDKNILNEKILDKTTQKEITKKLKATFKLSVLGHQDIEKAYQMGVLYSIAHTSRASTSQIEDLSKIALNENFNQIESDQRDFLVEAALKNILRLIRQDKDVLDSSTSKLLTSTYKKLAGLYERKDDRVSYEITMTDALRYACYAASSKTSYEQAFDRLKHFVLDSTYGQYGAQLVRKQNLEIIFGLTKGLSTYTDIDTKLAVATEICSRYSSLESYHKKRFEVYLRWLKISKKVLSSRVASSHDLNKLIRVTGLDVPFKYEDRDEEWLQQNRPDIIASRKHIVTTYAFLTALAQKKEVLTGSPELNSVLTLYVAGWLDIRSAYALFIKYTETELKVGRAPSPLMLLDDKKKNNLDRRELQIEGGESEKIEFKASWKYDLRTKAMSHDIVEKSALKAIASFLNTTGGTLFIGVDDSKNIIGIDQTDLSSLGKNMSKDKKIDKMRQIIDNAVKNKLGPRYLTNIKLEFCESSDETTFITIDIIRSEAPVWLEGNFYIRGTGSCQQLTENDVVQYIRSHFP